MGLKIPDLDDREYAEILEDARESIPIHAEEWTDHNVHDPGITILELLSWIAESDIYQLDRITEYHLRKYLKLLDVRPDPPKPATASLWLALPDGVPGTTIAAGEPLLVEDAPGESIRFQTTAPVTLTRANIVRIITDHRSGRIDNSNANETSGIHFLGFGADARVGNAMYLGFDADPFEAVGTLDVRVHLHEAGLPEPASHGSEPLDFEPTASVSWQYCTDYSKWYLNSVWTDFDVRHDGTNELYRTGTVRLDRPNDWSGGTATTDDEVLDQAAELVWIRCRIDRPDGGGPGHEVPPQFDAVTVNTVQVRHRSVVENEVLGRPDGGQETTARPGQTFVFEHRPVLERVKETEALLGPEEADENDERSVSERAAESNGDADSMVEAVAEGDVTIVLGMGDGDPQNVLDVPWMQVRDFDASGPDDRHFVLDHAAGEIRFGDGVQGKIPEPGRQVLAKTYHYGGGTAGNVSASSSWTFPQTEVMKEGIYRYYSEAERDRGMKGAIVVGEPHDDGGESGIDYGDWFDDVDSFTGTVDERGRSEVTIEVGTEIGGEAVAFSPAAVRIDPGTVVRFVWRSDSHSVVVEDQPPDGNWTGHPTSEITSFEFTSTFEPSIDPSTIAINAAGRATEGRDAESIDAALVRLKEDLQTPYRAVTTADYSAIATSTPGLRFGRAEAIVESGAAHEDCERHPTVRVIVVPFSTRDKPTPSTGFLEAVQCHLERHRLLTDRIEVEPPTYIGIGVDAEVRLVPGYAKSERAATVDARLREFLHPLSGFEGDGWPFGRPVYVSELYEVIEEVEGIDCVLDVGITAFGPNARYSDGNVEIGSSALVYSEDHDVIVGTERDDCGVGS